MDGERSTSEGDHRRWTAREDIRTAVDGQSASSAAGAE